MVQKSGELPTGDGDDVVSLRQQPGQRQLGGRAALTRSNRRHLAGERLRKRGCGCVEAARMLGWTVVSRHAIGTPEGRKCSCTAGAPMQP